MTTTKILDASDRVRCQAFAYCDQPAEGMIRHPVLGAYVACPRCAARLGQELEPAELSIEIRTG